MIKSPQAKSVSKHDIIRAIKNLVSHAEATSTRMDDLDWLIGEYINFNKDRDKFAKYLDGKYKQPEDKPSGRDVKTSKK